MITKITSGWVVQTFDDQDRCVSANFNAENASEWEDDSGRPTVPLNLYDPFVMLSSVELRALSEAIQEDVRTTLGLREDIEPELIDAVCEVVVNNINRKYVDEI